MRFQPAAGGLFFTAAIRSNPLLRFTRAWVGETFSIWPFKNYITIMITLIEMNTYLIIVDILERPSTTGGFWTGSILCPWVLKATITFPPIFLKHNSLSLINNNFFLQPTCSDLAGQVGNIEGSIGRGFSSNHGCSSALEHVVRCLRNQGEKK